MPKATKTKEEARLSPRANMDYYDAMECRKACGACCTAISISSLNKAAGVPCVHLSADYKCGLWGKPERPKVCISLQPRADMCGSSREEAMQILTELERLTRPSSEQTHSLPSGLT